MWNSSCYLGSVGGPGLLGYAGMGRRFDGVIAMLSRRLEWESDPELSRGMHYPTSWDPYFKAYMTLADVYRYPTQHFEHHRRQLTPGLPTEAWLVRHQRGASGERTGDPKERKRLEHSSI